MRVSLRKPFPVILLVVASLVAAGCPGSDSDSDSDAGGSTDAEADADSEQPGTGWRLATYAEVDGEQTLVAVGGARLDDDGEVTALHTDFNDGSVAAELAVNEYGAFLGFPKPGRSASSDGRQWVHLDSTGVDDTDAAMPVEVGDVEGDPPRIDDSPFGPLTITPIPGELVARDDGTTIASIGEEWVDEDDVVRRRLTRTALVGAFGEDSVAWSLSVADRDDSIDPGYQGTDPSQAMPAAALLRAAGTAPGSAGMAAVGPGAAVAGPAARAGDPGGDCTFVPRYDDLGNHVGVDWSEGCGPQIGELPTAEPSAQLPVTHPWDEPPPDLPRSTFPQEQQEERQRQQDLRACYAFVDDVAPFVDVLNPNFLIANLLSSHPLEESAASDSGRVFCDAIWGDPHVTTFDGTEYDFQAAGEFVTAKSPDVEVQQRFEGDQGVVTFLTAVAVRAGDHVVEQNAENEIRIDGELTELDHDGVVLDNGTFVALAPGTTGDVLVVTPDGSWIYIAVGLGTDAVTTLSEVTASQVVGGISGTPNGNGADDFTLRDGSVVPMDQIRTIEGLYGVFGGDWRVRPEERLFTDTPAEDWLTEEIVSLPTSMASLADFTPEEIAEARSVCEEAGVTNPATLDDCAYDVLVTGDDRWAEQAAEGITGQPDPDPDEDDPRGEGDAPLLVAAANCDLDALGAALDDGDDPDLRRADDGWTPLHFAAQEGCTDAAVVLLEAGARVDPRTDEDLVTPLYLAAQNGYDETVAELVAFGAATDAARADGSTPLLAAAFFGSTAVVQVLLDAGAAVGVARDEDGFSPLQASVQEGYLDAAALLLDHGADPDRPDDEGRTALLAAAFNGDTEAVRLLLDAGADPNRARASDGVTPLHFAAQEGYVEVVEELLATRAGARGPRRADPNAATDDGRTPLHSAAANDQVEIIEILLAAGADPTATDDQDQTPADVAGEQAQQVLEGS